MLQRILIGVGAPKAGSTYLAQLIDQSGHICVAPQKEVNFFCPRFELLNRGVDWYESQFPDKAAPVACDFSPSYFSDEYAPDLIREYYPNAELIATLRDPLRRAFSAFQHHKRACRVPPNATFGEAVSMFPHIIDDSHYERHLGRYLERFGHVHLLFFEEVVADPLSALNTILGKLDLPRAEAVEQRVERNSSWQPRSYLLVRLAKAANSLARRIGVESTIRALRESGLEAAFRQANARKPDTMPASLIQEYRNEFTGTNEYLRKLTGRDTLPWQ